MGGKLLGFLYTVDHKKPIGRPRGSEHNERLQIRVSDALLARVDEWRAAQRPIPSRSEAVRTLTEAALDLINWADKNDPSKT